MLIISITKVFLNGSYLLTLQSFILNIIQIFVKIHSVFKTNLFCPILN